MLDILQSLIQGRNDFFHRTIGMTPNNQRAAMMSRFMLNEVCYLDIFNRMYQTQLRNNLASAVLTFTIPNNFADPVPVVPSQSQINASLENIDSTTSNCAICQDSISSGACQIRQCGHLYHRTCILNWFGMNPRCPVCRHDIREEDRVTQTPPASEQTSSQQEDQ